MKFTLISRIVWMLFGIVCLCTVLQAQQKTKVNIRQADVLRHKAVVGEKVKQLIGNVILVHDEVVMSCDSADFYETENYIEAFGHVHIQDDTVNAYADKLYYDGKTQISELVDNVAMSNGHMELTTDRLFYQRKADLAYYTTGGKIVDAENELTSRHGYFYTAQNMAHFRHSVRLDNPRYNVRCDTLHYNTHTHMANFLGPTIITSEENTIFCEYGWYDTEADLAKFIRRAWIYTSDRQLIKGDTLYYDRNQGEGWAKRNVYWSDSTGEFIMLGHYAEYFEQGQKAMVTKHPLLIYKMDKDSMLLNADTLYTFMDSTYLEEDGHASRVFHAYYEVRIFKPNFQGRCDSLKYAFRDSTFRMYYEPVLWTDQTQMTADTVHILLRDKQIHRLFLYKSAFISRQQDSVLYNQIKGRDMTVHFRNDSLHRLFVAGNGESIYYADDDSNAYIGANKAKCNHIIMRFEQNKVSEVTFMEEPNAVLHPMTQINPEQFKLEGFTWQASRRPKNKYALYPPGKGIPARLPSLQPRLEPVPLKEH